MPPVLVPHAADSGSGIALEHPPFRGMLFCLSPGSGSRIAVGWCGAGRWTFRATFFVAHKAHVQ